MFRTATTARKKKKKQGNFLLYSCTPCDLERYEPISNQKIYLKRSIKS